MSQRFDDFIEAYQKFQQQGLDFVVVTLTKVIGSAPQELGAKMIVGSEGLLWGTVGGGKIENHLMQKCLAMLAEASSLNSTEELEVNLQRDIGMSCGGVVGFLLEAVLVDSPWSIAVFGAGHISQALIPLLLPLSVKVVCYETRSEWLEKLPEARNLQKKLVLVMADEVANLSPKTFVISLSMGHSTDLPILNRALRLEFPFVGVIGSEIKSKKLKEELQLLGCDRAAIERLVCPLGLKLGRNTPYEIAISILAQLLQKRDEKRRDETRRDDLLKKGSF